MDYFITIITITYNNFEGIKKTLNSLLKSDYGEPVEWVVVDGGSDDGTAGFIETRKELFTNRKCTLIYKNEKDQGRYDGMNKGISRMHGQWCIFLNAGDTFCFENSLSVLVRAAKDTMDKSVGIIYGDAILERNNRFKYAKAPAIGELDFKGANPICHQSCLMRADIMRRYMYDLQYRYAADFDFLVKAYKGGVKFKYVHEPIALYDKTGISSRNTVDVRREFASIAYKYNIITYQEFRRMIRLWGIKVMIKSLLPEKMITSLIRIRNYNRIKGWKETKENASEVGYRRL